MPTCITASAAASLIALSVRRTRSAAGAGSTLGTTAAASRAVSASRFAAASASAAAAASASAPAAAAGAASAVASAAPAAPGSAAVLAVLPGCSDTAAASPAALSACAEATATRTANKQHQARNLTTWVCRRRGFCRTCRAGCLHSTGGSALCTPNSCRSALACCHTEHTSECLAEGPVASGCCCCCCSTAAPTAAAALAAAAALLAYSGDSTCTCWATGQFSEHCAVPRVVREQQPAAAMTNRCRMVAGSQNHTPPAAGRAVGCTATEGQHMADHVLGGQGAAAHLLDVVNQLLALLGKVCMLLGACQLLDLCQGIGDELRRWLRHADHPAVLCGPPALGWLGQWTASHAVAHLVLCRQGLGVSLLCEQHVQHAHAWFRQQHSKAGGGSGWCLGCHQLNQAAFEWCSNHYQSRWCTCRP